jgi:hypothetical protein
MRFMADESCDFAVVRALREAGHDVLYVSETDPGAETMLSSHARTPKAAWY